MSDKNTKKTQAKKTPEPEKTGPLKGVNSFVKGREHFSQAISVIEGREGMTRKTRILIVDDDADFLSIFEEHLEQWYDVTACADAMVAYKQLLDDQFDLLITDFVMPAVNGMQLVGKIRETSGLEQLPIIVLTGVRDDLTVGVLQSSPFVTVLQKDESLEKVNELIHEICPETRVA